MCLHVLYIMCIVLKGKYSKEYPSNFGVLVHDPIPQIVLQHTMPLKSRRSRVAKQKRRQGQTGFETRASAPSPDNSVYCLSDSNTGDASTIATDSSNGRERNNQVAASVEGLQRLYSVFLPPHLQLNEDSRGKRQKTSKRSAVYTGGSRTTAWRRNVAQRKAAEGCRTLDSFVQRKVSFDIKSEAAQLMTPPKAAAQPLAT
jgi:hypothetical protein